MSTRPTAIAYVDGLNLFRRQLSGHPELKWLDPIKLAETLIPTHDVIRVRYFTSKIRAVVGSDPQAQTRQQHYLRALDSLAPRLSIEFGTMRVDTRKYPVVPAARDTDGKTVTARVRKIEEKGSDVALASWMVFDAAQGEADLYALMSSDSDFEPPMRILREELGVSTALLSPIASPATVLRDTDPLFVKAVRHDAILASQLPDDVATSTGIARRPAEWR